MLRHPVRGLEHLRERHPSPRPGALALLKVMSIVPQRRLLVNQPARCAHNMGKQRPPPWALAALRLVWLVGLSAAEHEAVARRWQRARTSPLLITTLRSHIPHLHSSWVAPLHATSFRGGHTFWPMLQAISGSAPSEINVPLLTIPRPHRPSFAMLPGRDRGRLGDRFPVAK